MNMTLIDSDVKEYISQLTLAEKYATQIEVIKRIVIESKYDCDVRDGIEKVLGIKREAKDDDEA